MLHLVSIKQPSDESLTRPGSCHIHQHFRSQNRTESWLTSTYAREKADIQPALPVPPSMTRSDTTQLSQGWLTPLPIKGRFPETPKGGEGREQTQLPDAGQSLSSHILKKIKGRRRKGWRKAGKSRGPKEGTGRSEDILGQSKANRKCRRRTGG